MGSFLLAALVAAGTLATACTSKNEGTPSKTDGGADSGLADGQVVPTFDPPPTMDEGISVLGRADTTIFDPSKKTGEGILMSWPGVQLRVKFKGSEVRASFNETVAPGLATLGLGTVSEYLVIVDDQVQPKVIQLVEDINDNILLWQGADGEHTLTLYRKTESRYGTTRFKGFSFPNGGAVLPIERPGRKILIIGDSISAGYGADKIGPYDANDPEVPTVGANCPKNIDLATDGAAPTNADRKLKEQGLLAAENTYVSYGSRVGQILKADTQIVAFSGIGLFQNRNPADVDVMPTLYDRVIADTQGRRVNPADWKPNAIVVNLGTNDFAMGDPGVNFQPKQEEFVKKLRGEYPDAYIALMIGPMVPFELNKKLVEYTQTTLMNLEAGGVKKVGSIKVTQNTNKVGCEYHPTAATHQVMGDSVASELKFALGWK
jgi:Carbohydrate esterase 2 N-terminal/GDSL-like Lipase/Acylhydrolase family